MFASINVARAYSLHGLALTNLCALGAPLSAHAQAVSACPASVKAEVAKAIQGAALLSQAEQLKTEAALYDKYKSCAAIGSRMPTTSERAPSRLDRHARSAGTAAQTHQTH